MPVPGSTVISPKFKATGPKTGVVWSPSQQQQQQQQQQHQQQLHQHQQHQQQQQQLNQQQEQTTGPDALNDSDKGDDVPKVWTPKGGASPTIERKEFRPINFDTSSVRRQKSQESPRTTGTPEGGFPWQEGEFTTTSERSTASTSLTSTLDRRLQLPRAQNPTITLLQKAREGQLPRGAHYLDSGISSNKMTSKSRDDEAAHIGPNDIVYTVKKEIESDDENNPRKIVQLSPKKYEGIGPTNREGLPIALRTGIKEENQGKWYRRMYDSLHRFGKDDSYVTVNYKPKRGRYPYTPAGGYMSEPEPGGYDSDHYTAKYATLDRRRIRNKEHDFTTSTMPRSKYVPASARYAPDVYRNQPKRIEDYEPGHSSIAEKEAKQWWDEVLGIFDGEVKQPAPPAKQQSNRNNPPVAKPLMSYALKESGYESDSTLVFKRREENLQNLSPTEQKQLYLDVQKGGEVPLHGLRKQAPERPKEPVIGPVPLPKTMGDPREASTASPHRYVESEVNIHYRSPVRSQSKEAVPEEELARRQEEAMRRIYMEERRRKYLQELQDMESRRHTDNFTPSQKSPIPLNRYDDFLEEAPAQRPRDRTPEPKMVARSLYNFTAQNARELSFKKGDIIFVRRQIDRNWFEGEHNAMVGLFPVNYVEIIPYDGVRTIPKKPTEGQARAKFSFVAQSPLELSLVKGELVVLTRRVDENWFEGRLGNRKGIFPASYVEVLIEPSEAPGGLSVHSPKPVATPASHSLIMNGTLPQHMTKSPYSTLTRPAAPVNQSLHIDTHSELVPYRALYNYRPQNDDELELFEGDTVYVMEKCDDGWYVGSSQRTGVFGTFPGNYVERI